MIIKSKSILSVFFLLFTSFVNSSFAAEFSFNCPTLNGVDQGCQIFLRGEIVPGDSERLLNIIRIPPPRNNLYRLFILDSPGGDVNEAFKLSRVVQDGLLETANYSTIDILTPSKNGPVGYTCASSCVLVLMSGTSRNFLTYNDCRIGLHRPYFSAKTYSDNIPASALADLQRKAMTNVQDFLLGEGMPRNLVEIMMNRSSKEIYWMDPARDLPYVRNSAAWFDEQKISRCNFDPLAESKVVEAIEKHDSAAEKRAMQRMVAALPCSWSLVRNAQAQLRSAK